MDDIARQARLGSVAAIIQILNEKLANDGVRTRAMFEDGMLQLLCEGETVEQLEQTGLVDRVRQILERISPRNIRRVNINSRIVREQQLLWLEEIHRDPENQLLWSEEITLAQPNPFKRFREDRRANQEINAAVSKATSPRSAQAKRHFWRGIVGGASLSLLLVLLGWVAYEWQKSSRRSAPATAASPTVMPSPAVATLSPVAGQDPFVQAVRLAEQAARDGQAATTPASWLDLATRWQRASDLMGQVPKQDGRYKTAQDRIGAYQKNSKAALQRAESMGAPTTTRSGQPQ